MKTARPQGAYIEVVHSPDDGGWYSVVYGKHGVDLWESPGVYETGREARAVAVKACDENCWGLMGVREFS